MSRNSSKGAGKSKVSAAEATRSVWQRVGPDAKGVEVGAAVKEEFGYSVPSSTISTAKNKVFGKSRRRAYKVRRRATVGGAGVNAKGVGPTVSVGALADAKRLIDSAGGADAAMEAVGIVGKLIA